MEELLLEWFEEELLLEPEVQTTWWERFWWTGETHL